MDSYCLAENVTFADQHESRGSGMPSINARRFSVRPAICSIDRPMGRQPLSAGEETTCHLAAAEGASRTFSTASGWGCLDMLQGHVLHP